MGLTIEVKDPAAAGERWASVLGVGVVSEGDGAVVHLESAGQALRFVPAGSERSEGIVEVRVSLDSAPAVADIGGVRFAIEAECAA